MNIGITGSEAEDFACKYLQNQGLTLIERNFSSRRGELDLVMLETKQLVFIEVRYRKSNVYGSALESVNQKKINKLLTAAQFFLLKHTEYNQYAARFDVIGLSGSLDNPQIDWIKNAFNG